MLHLIGVLLLMPDGYLSLMKTALLIAPYFVPRRRVGSLRPYKFASHLTSFGWKPVVFTIGTDQDALTEKEKKALRDVTVKQINTPFDRTTGSSSDQNVEPKHRVLSEWSDWIADWFDRQVPMDTWVFLFWSAYTKILKEVQSLDPDLIWSTGDPWSGHWLGHKLSRDLKKPWIADFRDPWTLSGLSLRERSFLSNRADRKLEKKFITAADKIIFTAQATEDLYKNHYSLNSDKTDTIYNSFEDSGSNEKPDISQTWQADIDDSKLNLIFFGSFRRLSPINPIAEAMAELPGELQKQINIHSFGTIEFKDLETLNRFGISDHFKTHEKVVPEQAKAVFERADILLVSTNAERKSIIPAKLWEYMLSDKPILSITPNPEIAEILKETGAGIHYHNSKTAEIAGVLKHAAERKLRGETVLEIERKPDQIKQYSAKNNTRKLAQIMDTITGDEQ